MDGSDLALRRSICAGSTCIRDAIVVSGKRLTQTQRDMGATKKSDERTEEMRNGGFPIRPLPKIEI